MARVTQHRLDRLGRQLDTRPTRRIVEQHPAGECHDTYTADDQRLTAEFVAASMLDLSGCSPTPGVALDPSRALVAAVEARGCECER